MIFYKDSNFLPKPSLFPFYPKSVIRDCGSYGLMTDLGYPNFGPKTHKTEAQEGEKTRKTTKNALFLKKTQIFFAGFKNCRNFALAIRKRINIMTP